MHNFFVETEHISEGAVLLCGENYNHAVNVLRIKPGETFTVVAPDNRMFICRAEGVFRDDGNAAAPVRKGQKGAFLKGAILEESQSSELPSEVWLFQCLPKSDKMEMIIQKAVELGASHIVPVQSKNCVSRLDEKTAIAKQKRWQAIARSAAEQSNRSLVPRVHEPVGIKEAVEMMERLDVRLIPYEEEHGFDGICEAIISFVPGISIGALIGPEGGFDPMEVSLAKRHGLLSVSLGRRILRCETAAIAMLSLIMLRLEIAGYIEETSESI